MMARHIIRLLTRLFVASACGVLPVFAQNAVTVELLNGDGSVMGFEGNGWRAFLGIPYAKPPLQALRFLPPEKNEPWHPAILDATDFKPNCAQYFKKRHPQWDGLGQNFDEDCLYLNIFAPIPRHSSALYPVAIFIHGGDFDEGGSNDRQLYAYHAAAEVGMIFVTFNYRLGIFGSLGSLELQTMSKDGSTGNAAFLDQRMVLHWVRSNIEAFHGDKDRVLLFGESSGAAAVSLHLTAPGSRGLFQRAAMQSGAFVTWGFKQLNVAQTIYDWLLNKTLCVNAGDFQVQCLQSMPWRQLEHLVDNADDMPFPDGWKNSSFTPTIDGTVLADDPVVLARQGHVAQVPVLLGCDKNEGVAFVTHCRTCYGYLKQTMSEHHYITWMKRNFAQPWADKLLERYSTGEYTPFFAAAQATGDLVVRCPTHRAARFLQKSSGSQIFLYRYTHEPISRKLHSGGLCATGAQGAFHGSEIPFFFHVPEFLRTRHEDALGKTMVHYLRNFAWSGDPNIFPPDSHDASVDMPPWPPFLNITEAAMTLGTLPDGKLIATYGELSAECELMDAYVDAGQPIPSQACGEKAGCAPMPHDEASDLALTSQTFPRIHAPKASDAISLI